MTRTPGRHVFLLALLTLTTTLLIASTAFADEYPVTFTTTSGNTVAGSSSLGTVTVTAYNSDGSGENLGLSLSGAIQTAESLTALTDRDTSLDKLVITLPPGTFDFQANAFGVFDNQGCGSKCEELFVSLLLQDGSSSSEYMPLVLTANSNNFFSITESRAISQIILGGTNYLDGNASARLYALKDVQVSASEVPEPGSLLLLGTALFGIAGAARRHSAI